MKTGDRVEIVAPLTIRGAFAGGKSPELGRRGEWVGYSPTSPSHCLVRLDGDAEPKAFLGSHVRRLS